MNCSWRRRTKSDTLIHTFFPLSVAYAWYIKIQASNSHNTCEDQSTAIKPLLLSQLYSLPPSHSTCTHQSCRAIDGRLAIDFDTDREHVPPQTVRLLLIGDLARTCKDTEVQKRGQKRVINIFIVMIRKELLISIFNPQMHN